MQHPISERINFLINHYSNGNVSSFSDRLELSRQAINRLFHPDLRTNRYPSPSIDVITTILKVFPEIDANWLMKGIGEPFNLLKSVENGEDWKSMYFETLKEKDIINKKYIALLEKVANG